MDEGEWLGGYRLLRRLGAGGAGTVFEAEDGGGDRVALKLVHPAMAQTEEARRRLAREASTLNSVRSDGVARVLDVETEGMQPFVVTELVEGPTLLQEIRSRGALPRDEVARLGRSLTRTLAAVHDAHVIHRDIKPSNVIVSPHGPVLIDFGIAQTQDDDRLTSTGMVTGTAGYTSPNLLRGGAATPADDRWSLAATLLNAATGRPPFGAGAPDLVMRRVLEGDPDLVGLTPSVADAFRRTLTRTDRPLGLHGLLDALAAPEPPAAETEVLSAPIAPEPATEVIPAPAPVPASEFAPPPDATQILVPPSQTPADAPIDATRTMPVEQPAPVTPPAQAAQPGQPAPAPAPWQPVDQMGSAFPPSPIPNAVPYPAYMPTYPRNATWLGLALMAALAMLPIVWGAAGTVTVAVVMVLSSAIGSTVTSTENRRFVAGGARSSDLWVGLARSPLALLMGVVRVAAALVIGGAVGSLTWFLLVFNGVLPTGLPKALPIDLAVAQGADPADIANGSFLGDAAGEIAQGAGPGAGTVVAVVWLCLFLMLAIAWVFPTMDHARRGLGLAATRLLHPLWTRVVVGLILVATVPMAWWVLTGGQL